MVLTLAGPRLWILLKELTFHLSQKFSGRVRSRSGPGPRVPLISRERDSLNSNRREANFLNRIWTRARLENEVLPVIEESHSELGAARDLITYPLAELRRNRIELTTDEGHIQEASNDISSFPFRSILAIWSNFMKRPTEIIVSFTVSLVLIGVFVGESTGTVLSANIVGNTMAIASTKRCFAPDYGKTSLRATAYVDQCYHAAAGTEGCNYFYTQSLGFKEEVVDTCPFAGDICTLLDKPAIKFDTGYLSATLLGINTPKQYQFRRVSFCAPVLNDQPRSLYESDNLNFTTPSEANGEELRSVGFSVRYHFLSLL